ncbi:MAG: hypothetical protein OXL97_14440 [Chloroflexota bacterium]|nr:hypothetical protein [Chloroflexota bacterium]MDE2884829.1 hypothetical protein [Chloroflexota bacterium]
MTTATVRLDDRVAAQRPDRRLEELAGRMIDALLASIGGRRGPGVARAVHDARRLRQAGDLDGALAAFSGLDPADASESEARWMFGEWVGLARRRFAGRGAAVYSPGTGRAAVLAPIDRVDGMLQVVAVLGMRWQPGQRISRRSLRGLRPLAGGSS